MLSDRLDRILAEKTAVSGYEMSYEVLLSEHIRTVG